MALSVSLIPPEKPELCTRGLIVKVSFPAMRGEMGGRTYYATLMKLNAVPKMFTFTDWIEFQAEDREQRILNKKRVPDITGYIIDNEDSYLFSSITASYKCKVDFVPVAGDDSLGLLTMDLQDAQFVINDGQHRCAAIAAALKENPNLGDESISVLLFPYESLDRVQQMFSDLNRFVVKTSKSLDILYDKRDELSQVAVEVCNRVPVFEGMIDKDAVSLPVRSRKLFTLSAVYDATKELLEGSLTELSHGARIEKAIAYWTAVSKAMPDWLKVKADDIKSTELRQEKICSHTVVLRAIGAVGAELMQSANWRDRLMDLGKIDWSKKNPDWQGVCIVANSVVSNRQSRLATKAYIKRQLGLKLTDAESRVLEAAHADATPVPAE